MESVCVGQAAHSVRNCEMKLGMVTVIWILLLACAHADPGYDHLNRDVELDNTDGIIDVESTEPLLSPHDAGKKQLRLGKPMAGYADYDYYMSGRRSHEGSSAGAGAGADNEQSGSSAIRVAASGEPGLRRSIDEMNVKSLPWYGPYAGKSIAMYPSRSYDPYIRRYDR